MSAAALNELNLESGPKAILLEWLESWFDGALHTVGQNDPILFPKCAIRFNQGKVDQPLSGDIKAKDTSSEIRVICLRRNEVARVTNNSLSGSGKTVTDYVIFNFWVRASKNNDGDDRLLAGSIAELLHAILGNPQTRFPLAPLGIKHLLPQKPDVVQSNNWPEFLLICSAQLEYTQGYTPGVPPYAPPTSSTVPFSFIRETAILPDQYLMGNATWPVIKTIKSASCIALAPQVTPLELTLEVNGILTPHKIIIGTGAPNTESTHSIDINLTVPTNNIVRWKCTSGSLDPSEAAWMISLTIQTA